MACRLLLLRVYHFPNVRVKDEGMRVWGVAYLHADVTDAQAEARKREEAAKAVSQRPTTPRADALGFKGKGLE